MQSVGVARVRVSYRVQTNGNYWIQSKRGWCNSHLRKAILACMQSLEFGNAAMFDSPNSKWFFEKVNEHPRLAHHPLCSCFDYHLIRIGGLSLCLGCTCLALGAILAITLLILLILQGQLPAALSQLIPTWGIGVFFFLPTLIQPFLQIKIFKMFSRTCLGVAIVLLWYAAVFLLGWDPLGITLRIGFVFVFWLVFKITNRFRNRFTPDPKTTCEKGCYPFCGGNERRFKQILAELKDRTEPDDPFIRFAEALITSRDGSFTIPEN